VQEDGSDEDEAVAALLHDCVEDKPTEMSDALWAENGELNPMKVPRLSSYDSQRLAGCHTCRRALRSGEAVALIAKERAQEQKIQSDP
jgi:hypothetical protein